MSDLESLRSLQQQPMPGEFSAAALSASGIQLTTSGGCPACGRPLLGLTHGGCTFCEARGPWFEALPAVAARLDAMALGWTLERLKRWAEPRPAQLAWAYRRKRWEALVTWVDEDFRGALARLEMNRRDRGRMLQIEAVEVSDLRLEAIHDYDPWLTLRVAGQRIAYLMNDQGEAFEGAIEPAPFLEFWRLRPTGAFEKPSEMVCTSCGAPIAFEAERCGSCGGVAPRKAGPWLLEGILTPRSRDAHAELGGPLAWAGEGKIPYLPAKL